MATKLENAKNKLGALKTEQDEIVKAIRKEHDLIPFGQPVIIGRRDIYKDLKRHYGKSIANSIEQDKQEKRIEMLEKSIKEYKENNDFENAMKCDIKRSTFQLIADDLRKELQS